MISITTPTSIRILIVEVPEGAHNFAHGFDTPYWIFYYPKGNSDSFDHRHITLSPDYDYKIIGTLDKVDDFSRYVYYESDMGYEDYFGRYLAAGSEYCLDHSKDSFLSFLKSQGVDVKEKNILLIEVKS